MKIAARTENSSRFSEALGGAFLAALLLVPLPVYSGSGMAGGEQAPPQAAARQVSKPLRTVSICLQGDQLLLQLLPRERIVALSTLAADPDLSARWEVARGIPMTRGDAEELIRLKPDLVLASVYSNPLTVAMVGRLGVPVLLLGIPANFDELRDQIRHAGRSLGEVARAEEVVRSMDARLERLKAKSPPVDKRPTALFYFQDHFTPGSNTFPNAILEAAGFRNLASTFSTGNDVWASAESIIMARPQYLIMTQYKATSPTETQVSADGPLFRKLGADTKVISVPFRNLVSPDPDNLELAEMLQGLIYQ